MIRKFKKNLFKKYFTQSLIAPPALENAEEKLNEEKKHKRIRKEERNENHAKRIELVSLQSIQEATSCSIYFDQFL